jgi:hypothetical protein
MQISLGERSGNNKTMDDNERSVFCGGCGSPLDQPANLPVKERIPCPICGSTFRQINVTCNEKLKLAGSLSMELTPGTQARDWRQRWTEIQEHLKRLLASHSEPISAASIQNANHDLHSFFIQAYHLKDSLIKDAGTTGVTKTTTENAITADPHLALLADLANLDKHGKLRGSPRSGDIPTWKVSGVSEGDAGWRLSLTIRHKSKTLDGLDFAAEVVSAWKAHLNQWGLI